MKRLPTVDGEILMDALERIKGIGLIAPGEHWNGPQFFDAGREGKRRWQELEGLFELQWPMFADAVAVLDPAFRLPADEETAALSAKWPRMWCVNSGILISFLKWERCPTTAGLLNPYEPWIEIWEHGGAFRVEHGQFVDVFDATFMPLGAVFVRRA